jgi:IS5 family transposase
MNKQELQDGNVPDRATYVTGNFAAETEYQIDRSDDTVRLQIDNFWFKKADLKELRKLLKALIAELP